MGPGRSEEREHQTSSVGAKPIKAAAAVLRMLESTGMLQCRRLIPATDAWKNTGLPKRPGANRFGSLSVIEFSGFSVSTSDDAKRPGPNHQSLEIKAGLT